MTQTRRKVKQVRSVEERMADQAAELKSLAALAPPGPERDDLLERARTAEFGAHFRGWLRLTGSQPPDEIP